VKVKELLKLLEGYDPKAEVILQKDAEGNGYSPLEGVDDEAVYVADNSWSGNVYDTKWTADEACMDEDDWERLMKRKRCVVLYPVN